MQALNHTAFAIVLAVTLSAPVALPVALGSHFVLDSIPHYGNDDRAPRGSRRYMIRIALDAILSVILLAWFMYHYPARSNVILLSAFLSILPDLLWPLVFVVHKTSLLWRFFVFHKQIQRESSMGLYYEGFYFLCFLVLGLVR